MTAPGAECATPGAGEGARAEGDTATDPAGRLSSGPPGRRV